MKKLLLFGVVLSLFFAGFFGVNTHNAYTSTQLNNQILHFAEMACKYDQCHATAASTGQRCKHCVSNRGDYYCWQHK